MQVAMRRAGNPERGCGYWAAVSYLNKHGVKTKEQKQADAVSEIIANAQIQDQLMRREDKHGIRKPKHRFTDKPVSSLSEQSKRNLAYIGSR